MEEQKKWFLEIKSTLGIGAAKIVITTAKDLVDKSAVEFERISFNFEKKKILLWIKSYPNSII